MKQKVRIGIDKSKDYKFSLEIFNGELWEVNRRFKTKRRVQDHIDNLYRNSQQEKDFKYE